MASTSRSAAVPPLMAKRRSETTPLTTTACPRHFRKVHIGQSSTGPQAVVARRRPLESTGLFGPVNSHYKFVLPRDPPGDDAGPGGRDGEEEAGDRARPDRRQVRDEAA